MQKGKPPFSVTVKNLTDENGEPITCAPHPMMKFSFECDKAIEPGSILRKII
ncbi:MAG: U32 family peptidase C-terminal domain-containing protein [Acutalibacteraceae bacterium]